MFAPDIEYPALSRDQTRHALLASQSILLKGKTLEL
jgi:hypothetical protein